MPGAHAAGAQRHLHPSAAHAQAAGFRPCLRCRPETAPDSPAWQGSLASVSRALRLIEDGALAEGDAEALAERLGMTGRHLRRLFVQHLDVTPAAVESTRRIHLAKGLIHETRLPMTTVALAAGYGSLRRFNEAFQELFGRSPTALRRDAAAGRPAEDPSDALRLRLAYLRRSTGRRGSRAAQRPPCASRGARARPSSAGWRWRARPPWSSCARGRAPACWWSCRTRRCAAWPAPRPC